MFPYKRKRLLKTPAELKRLPDDCKDIFKGSYVDSWYPSRPKSLKDVSLYEFTRLYERIGPARANQFKDKTVFLKLLNDQGYMKKRTHPEKWIVYGPSYFDPTSETDKEEFYFSHLLLHKPYRSETELKGPSLTYEAEYLRLKNEIPTLEQSVENMLKKKDARNNEEKIDAEISKDDAEGSCNFDSEHGV